MSVSRSRHRRKARLRPAVFLDRDGVLNRCEVVNGKPYAPRRLRDFRLLPGVADAVRALKDAGFLLVVATNQPDIGNGLVAAATVAAMHDRLRARLPLDAIELCPHKQAAGCGCRKPKPGMLRRAARRLGISLADSVMVGDRASDIAAGKAAGCRTIFIDRRYRESGPVGADAIARSLPAAVRVILAGTLRPSRLPSRRKNAMRAHGQKAPRAGSGARQATAR